MNPGVSTPGLLPTLQKVARQVTFGAKPLRSHSLWSDWGAELEMNPRLETEAQRLLLAGYRWEKLVAVILMVIP